MKKNMFYMMAVMTIAFTFCSEKKEKEPETDECIRYDLSHSATWSLASIPQCDKATNRLFPESLLNDDLQIGMNRALLAWYSIDPLFNNKLYMAVQVTPDYIFNNPERWTSSNFVRTICEEEFFPNKTHDDFMFTAVLNIAYYPMERGPYNYDTHGTAYSAGVDANGLLNNPRTRWGGMMRTINPNDFETNNIKYIEFWMMDPFVEEMENADGADLYFNLGEISEDILKDGYKSAEQGLPTNDDLSGVFSTAWGYVPKEPTTTHSFQYHNKQDVGLDGMNSAHERDYFAAFIDDLALITPVDSKAFKDIWDDPSTDDYVPPRDVRWNVMQADILTRYKHFNKTEGNSSHYNLSNSSLPDEEDINRDNIMNETESYYQYKVSIRKAYLQVGTNYIVNKVAGIGNTTANGNIPKADWYQFRIPINEFEQTVGEIHDFKSIRFMRMFLTNCPDSLILRFARMELVRCE